jgi:uncharacterized BrkB/YihY/UPF0761 family membrane protein
MTTIRDFIPPEVKNTVLGLVALLALCVAGSNLYVALKTGVAQRLSDTPRYTRSEKPVRFWLLVIFFAISAMVFAALLIAAIVHWHEEKVF